MLAVILAGGEGKRLRPLTLTTTKPLVPVLNRPFLEHMMEHLRGHGVSEVALTLHHLASQVRAHFKAGQFMGMKLHFVEEQQPLGTAGGLTSILPLLKETFVVCNGDIFTDLDLGAVLRFHRENRAQATIVLTPVDDPTPYGMVEMTATGQVVRFVEKPKADRVTTMWVNAGTYILEPDVLRHVPDGQPFMFEQGLFPRLLELKAPVFAYRSRAYWRDMGTPHQYLRLHRELLLNSTTVRMPGQQLRNAIWAGPGCNVEPGADLQGPILLGSACRIAAGSFLRGPLVLGDGCAVGEGAQLKDSVLWSRVQINARATVQESILGRDVVIEEEAVVGPVCVLGEGSVVGKGNQLAGGLALWPGKRLEPGTLSLLAASS